MLPQKEKIKIESPTTKIRILFDASAKKNDGVSLNCILHTGSCFNPELYKLLLQLQLYPVTITADIERAYL